MRAIHNEFAQSQRRRDKTDAMKSKQLATYDPKKKKKQATNEWKETCEMEKLRAEAKVRQIAGKSGNGAGIGLEFVDLGDRVMGPRQSGGSCCLFSKRSASRRGW